MTLDESIGLWEKEHKYEIVHACNMDMEVHEIVDRVNPWHTGTPTEEGWYLLKLVDEYGRITYDANCLRKGIKGMEWKYAFFGHVIIKWQSIEDEPEVMMG